MPLSPAELQALSDDLAFARPDSCVLQRLTSTRGAGGAQTSTRTDLPAVSCRVDAGNRMATEGVVGGRITPVMDYKVALPYGTVVQEDDLLRVNNTYTLNIVGDTSLSSYHAEVELFCRAVT